MIETFAHAGITFRYPGDWSLDVEQDGDDWTATLQSPGSAVLMLTYSDGEEPANIADEALESLQQDYDELDSEIAIEKLCGQTAVGHDIDVLTLDLAVVIRSRALAAKQGALLLLWQFPERDQSHYEPVVAAILASLSIA